MDIAAGLSSPRKRSTKFSDNARISVSVFVRPQEDGRYKMTTPRPRQPTDFNEKATAEQQRVRDAREIRDALATLKEKVALARASAEARREHYNAKSQRALDDAARYFDPANDAAAKRYEGT
jgi:hypothetical protein